MSDSDDSDLRELEEEEAMVEALKAAEAAAAESRKGSGKSSAMLAKLAETEDRVLEAFASCSAAVHSIRAAAMAREGEKGAAHPSPSVAINAAAEAQHEEEVARQATRAVEAIEDAQRVLKGVLVEHRSVPFAANEFSARRELGIAMRCIAVMAAKVRALRPAG